MLTDLKRNLQKWQVVNIRQHISCLTVRNFTGNFILFVRNFIDDIIAISSWGWMLQLSQLSFGQLFAVITCLGHLHNNWNCLKQKITFVLSCILCINIYTPSIITGVVGSVLSIAYSYYVSASCLCPLVVQEICPLVVCVR